MEVERSTPPQAPCWEKGPCSPVGNILVHPEKARVPSWRAARPLSTRYTKPSPPASHPFYGPRPSSVLARCRSRERMGAGRDGGSGCPHRRRLAQPRALRRRPRRVHVRRPLRHVRADVPLRDVAPAPADRALLAARVAGVFSAGPARAQRRPLGEARGLGGTRQPVHLRARPAPGGHPPPHHVGLPDRRRDHVPARVRVAPLPARPWRHLALYEAVVFGFPAFQFPHASAAGFFLFHGLVWASFLVIAGRDAGDAAADARGGRGGGPAVRRGLHAADPPVRRQRDRADADRQLHLDGGLRLRVHRHPPRRDGHRDVPVAPVREVLPRVPAAGPARRRVLQGRRARGRARPLPPVRPRVHVEDARRGPHRGRAPARLPLRGPGGARPPRRRGGGGAAAPAVEHYQWICPPCRRASFVTAQALAWRGRRGGETLPADGGPLPMPVYANPGRGEGPLGPEDAANFHP